MVDKERMSLRLTPLSDRKGIQSINNLCHFSHTRGKKTGGGLTNPGSLGKWKWQSKRWCWCVFYACAFLPVGRGSIMFWVVHWSVHTWVHPGWGTLQLASDSASFAEVCLANREFTGKLLPSTYTITIYLYYLVWKLMLILLSHRGWKAQSI